ncbi:oxygenase MpaB family protein [Gordonia sp. Z-3]|uniref:oxygenase MpaB family protein n=1 Tax=Gordonia sp. Z-3 TaxID=3115408 RepID=UPI002E2DFD6B|nr:oxygenase MpaB family protein [Gordonia sp. Z-3]MED5799832.1 oxygenase MpaB family protein [Gordonia sp. Z-3]
MAGRYLASMADTTPELTNAQTRITIPARRQRVTTGRKPARIQEAVDFWAFAGAAANVVMQLGWPEVAYGVMESKVESGSLMKHPWKRARTTAQYLSVAILGDDEEKAAFRDAVNAAHRHVRSDEKSPVAYNAFDRELQMWVAACLFVGIEDTHQLLHGIMSPADAEEFYQSAKTLGTTLQVPDDMWPATRTEFDHYWNVASGRVAIDETTKRFLNDLIELRMISPALRVPFAPLLRFLTIGTLPPLFREQLGLEWSARDQRRFNRLFATVSTANRALPKPIRFGGNRLLMRDLRLRIKHDWSVV